MLDRKKVLSQLVRVGVSTAIVLYILFDVDHGDLGRAISRIRPLYLVEALALYAFSQTLSGLKWAMLGRSVGLRRSWAEYVRFYFIGMFFNIFGLSTLGGDLVRALFLGRGKRLALAINSVMFDRMSGLAILMALGSVALLTFPQPHLPWLLTAGAIWVGIGLIVGWWMCPRLVRLLPAGNRIRHHVEVDLLPFWRDPWLLLRVGLVSLCFHLSQTVVQWILIRAAGAEVPFTYCLVFHPILSVMMALPVSLGGFGVREGGYLYFLTQINVDDSIAVATGLLWWAMSMLAGLIGGALFMISGATIPKLGARAEERPTGERPEPEQTPIGSAAAS